MTVSHWQHSHRLGTLRCDCLVIGGGICGISAALHLQRRGVDVLLVDRAAIGSGASGRNAGFLMRGCADNYADAARDFGRDAARELWRLTEANLAGLRAEGIDALATTRRIPSVLLGLRADEQQKLLSSREMMEADGFDVGWWEAVSPPRDALWNHLRGVGGTPVVGLVNPHDASCHSLDVLHLLAGKLTCPRLEHEEVTELDDGPGAMGGVRVRLRQGEVLANRVLVCTNAYGPLLVPELADRITPRRGQMLALTPTSRGAGALQLAASYYVNFGSEYVRDTGDGTILVGGCRTMHADREVGYEDMTTPWVQESLEAFATSVLGDWAGLGYRISARWSGVMGFSATHLPIITRVPRFRAEVLFCGGFTGHGMSMAYEVSRRAVGVLCDGLDAGLFADPNAAHKASARLTS
jgi:gamma-glutamylputrescine oxidase